MIDRSAENFDLTSSLVTSMHQCDTPLSRSFFSATNMDSIQSNLRLIVREKTGYIIGRQSEEQVALIMRSIFTLYANSGAPVENEVRRLNAIVLSELAPQVGTGIAAYLGYVRDASRPHIPLENPKNMSQKGTRMTELFKGF
jgi:hypothetical protein